MTYRLPTRLVLPMLAMSLACSTVAAQDVTGTDPIPKCTNSVVMVHCDARHSVYLDDDARRAASIDSGNADLGRVVVTAPWFKRARPEEVISTIGGKLRTTLAPEQMNPGIGFGVKGPAGSVREDRDGFGLSTECQQSGLTCANQPGRPSTRRFGD